MLYLDTLDKLRRKQDTKPICYLSRDDKRFAEYS